ncbi:glycosyltransferase family 4 protein [Sphingobacterium hotanense]|uniref:Glycosyltransferase family 4 protein n=2 Tax=Sphingobacterium hotanense TaxID=649196 RepID=A0ABT7NTU5_9SPHI|nr:glycosyltransferase family 4 protein [Sphingobacterium hotanense]
MLICIMGKRVLIIGLVWPEPNSSAAGWRMLELVKCFLAYGYDVHFACAAGKSEYSFPLTDLQVSEHNILLNDSSFDSFITELHPEIVLFDRFMVEEQYSWRVKSACPNALLILDTEDLHSIRLARQQSHKSNKELSEDSYANAHSLREIAAILRCDLSLIISSYEMEVLDRVFRVAPELLQFLPFHITAEQRENPGFQDRANFAFIGNFIHEPNWQTVLALKKIWPSIRKQLPAAELHVYGAYPSQKVWELNKPKDGFIIKGRTENAIETLAQYRVLLAPIPFGAGLKGKFIDALRAGTPSITTTIGAEGFSNNELWNGYITDEEEDFVANAVQLASHESDWQQASEKGEQLLKALNSEALFSEFMSTIEKLQDNLDAHRRQNIMGQILWSNQFSATKYMSLWIEAKNKG